VWPAAAAAGAAAAGAAAAGAAAGAGVRDKLPRGFDSIPSALDALAAGEVVVVLDDEDRENEGDLVMAADKVPPASQPSAARCTPGARRAPRLSPRPPQVTTEAMAFFVEHTSGVVCIAMEGAALDRLALPLMVPSRENEEALYTAFTVTVDARRGISTGISAADRALTVRLLADPGSAAADFRRPGHMFPLRYRPGGVLARPGHTEAAVDLARLAGCQPAGAARPFASAPGRSQGAVLPTRALPAADTIRSAALSARAPASACCQRGRRVGPCIRPQPQPCVLAVGLEDMLRCSAVQACCARWSTMRTGAGDEV
jgi:3,4-dihydroxy-2-butanone 4-phosphate synthase